MTDTNTFTVLSEALKTLWTGVADFILKLVPALVIFLIGWLIAVLLAKAVWHLIKVLKLDQVLENLGFKNLWEKTGYKLNTPLFFYELVKWFLIIVFLKTAISILGLTDVSLFLDKVVNYVPNIIVAAIILIAGAFVARFLQGLVAGASRAAGLQAATFLGVVTRWVIMIFAILAALAQLNIGDMITASIAQGLMIAIALGLGLSFGLGGKEHAAELIARLRRHTQE